MYKLLLCVRYLQTRYLAFICIVSVMLGVATLIVVNAVMSGFSTKLKDRLHGVLSDVIIDTDRTDGFYVPDDKGNPLTPDQIIAKITAGPAGDKIASITVNLRGKDIADTKLTDVMKSAVLCGALRELTAQPITYVNAISVAEELGQSESAPLP